MQINMNELMRIITNHMAVRPKPVSIELITPLISEQVLQSYPIQLKQVYYHVFNDKKNLLQISKYLPFQIKRTKVPVCNKHFKQRDEVYQCIQCSQHQSAVFCVSCFENGKHNGHRFQKLSSGGGNCDCGNPDAIKPSGYCCNHSGKLQIPNITEEQQRQFISLIGELMYWVFLLSAQGKDSHFSSHLIEYLTKLNKQSIYYNVLTFRLLTNNVPKLNKNFLDRSLEIKNRNLVQDIKELFFQMFNLDDFKSFLANSYLTAYNTIEGFQKTPYQSLYIQLFANQKVIYDIIQKYNNTIFVTKKKYEIETYLQQIQFVSTMRHKGAEAFFTQYIKKNQYIPFLPIENIIQSFQLKNEMHQVDCVSKNINTQNLYYNTVMQMVLILNGNQQSQKNFLKGYFNLLESQKYIFVKNKDVIPFHRSFAIGIFAFSKGNIQSIITQRLVQFLDTTKQKFLDFYYKQIQIVLTCILHFSETFVRNTYFSNYNILYARSGVVCHNFDYLFIKEAAFLFKQNNISFGKIIKTIFEESLIEQKNNSQNQTMAQFINKWIYFYMILVEISYSILPEIYLDSSLQIKNKDLKKKRKQIFISIQKKVSSINQQQKKIIQKCFSISVDDSILEQNTLFNRETKKYQIKQTQYVKNIQQFKYQIYVSKKKSGQTLLTEIKKLNTSEKQQNYPYQNQIIETIFPFELLSQFTDFILSQKKLIQQFDDIKNISNNYASLLYNLSSVNSTRNQYEDLKRKINGTNDQVKNVVKNNEVEKVRNQSLKVRLNDKKQRFLKKQSQVLKRLEQKQLINKKQQPETDDCMNCILCKDEKKKNEVLFYFGSVKHQSLLCKKNKDNQIGLVFKSCFHIVHYSCFEQIKNKQYSLKCPLCKSICNILIPINLNNPYSSTFNGIVQRIHVKVYSLATIFNPKFVQKVESCNEEGFKTAYFFLQIFSSMTQMIGFTGVFNSQEFQKKQWMICKQMIKLLSQLWSILTEKQKELVSTNFQLLMKEKHSEDVHLFQIINKYVTIEIAKVILKNQEFRSEKVFQAYINFINFEDLQIICRNLSMIFSQNQIEQSKMMPQQGQNKIKKLKDLIQCYHPPKTIKQMISQRDKYHTKSSQMRQYLNQCKNWHQILVCCICSEVVCLDCKTLNDHCSSHGSENMFFSLLTGQIILKFYKALSLNCIYENSMGLTWNIKKQPEGYTLNQNLYNNLINSLIFHGLESFLQNKMSEMISELY